MNRRLLPAILLASIIGLASSAVEAQDEIPAEYDNFASETIHIGVVVSDLDASVRFYEDVIGMQRAFSFDVDEDSGRRTGLSNGVPFHVEVLQLGTGESATQWKLMSFGEKSARKENAFIQEHTGMQYTTIFVQNLTAAIDRINAHDVDMLGETPIQLNDGRHFVLIKDPDGTFVELIGPME